MPLHPSNRVLFLLELLQTHARISGTELAARLGVDGRTVRRYIRTLGDLGIPVSTVPGRYGGYSLAAGTRLPPLILSDQETLALALSVKVAANLELQAIIPALTEFEARLERLMPDAVAQQVHAVSEAAGLLKRDDASVSESAFAQGHTVEVLLYTKMVQARLELGYQVGFLESTREGVLLRTQVPEISWLVGRLMSLSFPFDILSPSTLRTAVRERAARLLSINL